MANDKAIVTQAAQKYGIDPKVLWGLYGTETSFGKNVSTSSAGAVGPFQFEPATARAMGVNPYDFKSAAYGAARYLAQYKARGVGGMLSAYNAGPGGGYQAGYVATTLANAKSYGGAPGATIGASAPSMPGAATTTARVVSRPNPKAAGLRLLAQQYAQSDPILAEALEAKATQPIATRIASTAAGTPATSTEAQALVQAPPNLSRPAKAPVKIDLAKAKAKYGVGRGGSFPIPKPGEVSKGLEADLELQKTPPVIAKAPGGTVVKHPSGVPVYIPNQRRGRR